MKLDNCFKLLHYKQEQEAEQKSPLRSGSSSATLVIRRENKTRVKCFFPHTKTIPTYINKSFLHHGQTLQIGVIYCISNQHYDLFLNIKSFCIIHVLHFMTVFWIRIQLNPDPDPAKNLNPDPNPSYFLTPKLIISENNI